MKKFYLFLAFAIALAISAKADFYVACAGRTEPSDPFVIPWTDSNFYVGEFTTASDNSFLKISDTKGTSIGDWATFNNGCIMTEANQDFTIDKKVKFRFYPGAETDMIPKAGTYTIIICKEPDNYYYIITPKKPYHIHTWDWTEEGTGIKKNTVLNSTLTTVAAKTFQEKEDGSYELSFPTPVTLSEGEYFLITYNEYAVIGEDVNVQYFKHDVASEARTSWPLKNGSYDCLLAPGTYYSATIKDGVLKFNTYAKTTTGLDALLKEDAADYVEIGSEIFVQEHHQNYYSVYTTESSTYVAPNANQDTKYYGDDPAKFAQRDWVKIYAPGETGFVGKNIAAGTIIEVATGKAVKWGTVGGDAPVFTPNLYRPLNFSATETDKDVMYIFQPQEGEVLQVRGKYAKVGDNEYLTDNKAEHKVGLLGFTESKMTEGEWYTLKGHVCGGSVYYTGFETATGVESVETANATVFAANGTINVSSDAEASIEVYTANGQMIRAINADNASFAVAPGFYLVKVGNQVSKVIVK